MVAINSNIEESASLDLAKSIDAVGKLEITTALSPTVRTFNTGSATLVAPNKIITAAHVIDPNRDGIIDVKDVARYSFLLGDDLEADADYDLSISQVSLHPSWIASEANRIAIIDGTESTNSRYDVAVLTLSNNFTGVEPIPLSPIVPELSDNASLLRKKGTIVGYGQSGRPSAVLNNGKTRRGAENIIDSVANGLIRFDYDSTFRFQQGSNEGLNNPNLDGSVPELIPIPNSSPKPIRLEGGIGEGDSGGPLLVESDLGTPIVVGVASKFIDPDSSGIPISGYGSVYVYSALNNPETVEFLNAENAIDLDTTVTTSSVFSRDSEILDSDLIFQKLALPISIDLKSNQTFFILKTTT